MSRKRIHDGLYDPGNLTGDQLTWALHRENRADFKAIKSRVTLLTAIVLILLAAELTGFHVVPDPTIHIPFHAFGV
jgi:hypothetical protein